MGQGWSAIEDRPKLLKDDDLMTGKTEKSETKGANERHQMVVENVYKLLQCPLCTTIMSSPIYQCPNGHNLCSICKIRVQSCCPICQADMGSIRCLALEKLTEPLEIPYQCPYDNSECLKTGSIKELVTHLKDDHNVDIHDGFEFNQPYAQSFSHDDMEKPKGTMSAIFRCYGQEFCYHFVDTLVGMAPCYVAFLRFMGEEKKAKEFKYYLRVNGNGRILIWLGVPRSIRDSSQMVRDSLDGLVIPHNLARSLSCGNDQELKLRIHVTISIK